MRQIVVARIASASMVSSLFVACFSPPPPEQSDTSDTTASTSAAETSGPTTTSAPATTDTSEPADTSLTPTTTLPATSAPQTDTTEPPQTTSGESTTSTSSDDTTSTVDGTTSLSSTTDGDLCGNGVVDMGEECDDGNANDNDTCTVACKSGKCGDALVLIGAEECDDGNEDNTDECVLGCLDAKCGDSYLHTGVEECDDGNNVNGDGCSNFCALEPCGNGEIDPGEVCDDGNHVAGDGCSKLCQRDAAFVFLSTDTFTGAEMGDALDFAVTRCALERDTLENSMVGVQALGTFKPWMSDNMTSPAATYTKSNTPYVLPDGNKVADNWTDLTDGSLDHAINVTSSLTAINLAGSPCGPETLVWTGTGTMGQSLAATCNNWTTLGMYNGTVGSARATTAQWTNCMDQMCTLSFRMFCFEQLP